MAHSVALISIERIQMKLLYIKPARDGVHKYVATFVQGERVRHVAFGAVGYTDYLQSGDEDRKKRYLARHKTRENWSDPTSAGALSRYILWGPSTSFRTNVLHFKSRFHLV